MVVEDVTATLVVVIEVVLSVLDVVVLSVVVVLLGLSSVKMPTKLS